MELPDGETAAAMRLAEELGTLAAELWFEKKLDDFPPREDPSDADDD